MSIISASDFGAGLYRISQQTFTTTDLTAYISQLEAELLAPLFGAELYTLFNADLDAGVPQSARFVSVFNPFVEDMTTPGSLSTFYVGSPFDPYFPGGDPRLRNSEIAQSFGIPDMLKAFTYFHFMRDQPFKSTPAGTTIPDQDVSRQPSSGGRSRRLEQAYNRGVQSYQAIQWYMSRSEHAGDYPEYNGTPNSNIYLGGAV